MAHRDREMCTEGSSRHDQRKQPADPRRHRYKVEKLKIDGDVVKEGPGSVAGERHRPQPGQRDEHQDADSRCSPDQETTHGHQGRETCSRQQVATKLEVGTEEDGLLDETWCVDPGA